MDDDRMSFLEFLQALAEVNQKKTPVMEMARSAKEMYDAFKNEGFNDEQSLDLVKTVMGGVMKSVVD